MKRHLRHTVASGMIACGLVLASGLPLQAQSSVVDVPPPQVLDYWISISRQPGGALIFDGFAPDAATRDRLGEHAGADISWLKLGSGAPSGYDAALAFGFGVLDRLSEGRFALRGSVISLSGIAASQADFLALHQTLAEKALPGLILAKAEISAPRAEPYTFSLRRQANGNVLLSGFVPDPALEQRLLNQVGSRSSSTLRFGSGEPLNFEAEIDKILPLFALLQEGEIRLENGGWLFSGTPRNAADADAIRAAFSADGLSEAGWSLALAAPAAAVEPQIAEAPPEAVVTEPVQAEEPAAPVPQAAPVADETPEPEPTADTAIAEPARPLAAPSASAPDTLQQCRTTLAELSAQNGILFRSGAAVLAEGADAVLRAIADTVNQCPDAAIDVAGHTDADGDAAANLALSVARAEAVIAALAGLGVAPERLYAIGYGESQPIADNATAAGKAQNRRIVVSVRDGA